MDFSQTVVQWQRAHGRYGLPWQGVRDPYRVWLSEIMLQQTQVVTVQAYYLRFLQRFADVRALAAASLDDVLALWSGLGYYSRARNLHRCALAVVQQHGGVFPNSAAELAQLPGIGPSTAAAIAAFCFDERVAILDGNVKRVLSRVLAFNGDMAVASEQRRLWDQATQLLPRDSADMPAYTQGLMDLGATVCAVRQPQCDQCPVMAGCAARRTDSVAAYPVKSRRLVRKARENWWLWVQWRDQVWLQQRPPTGVWAGLWTLPLYDDPAALRLAAQAVAAPLAQLPTIRHALTHFDWTLHPWRMLLSRRPAPAVLAGLGEGRWVALDGLVGVALPAPLSKLLGTAVPAAVA